MSTTASKLGYSSYSRIRMIIERRRCSELQPLVLSTLLLQYRYLYHLSIHYHPLITLAKRPVFDHVVNHSLHLYDIELDLQFEGISFQYLVIITCIMMFLMHSCLILLIAFKPCRYIHSLTYCSYTRITIPNTTPFLHGLPLF